MPFDPQKLLTMQPIVTRHEFSQRDTMLYALGVGAHELEFIYEENLVALPTMASVMAYPGFLWREPELEIDWPRVLHGEQSVEIHAPLPVAGVLRGWLLERGLVELGASTLDGLEEADALALCNAVRGILPVASLGARAWAGHPLLAELQERLAMAYPMFSVAREGA